MGIWVSAGTHNFLRTLAEANQRSVPVIVDDIIEEVLPEMRDWIGSDDRIEYLLQQKDDEGIRLVCVTQEAIGKIHAYAEGLEITNGQALDEMGWAMALIMQRRQQQEIEKRKVTTDHFAQLAENMLGGTEAGRLLASLRKHPESSRPASSVERELGDSSEEDVEFD